MAFFRTYECPECGAVFDHMHQRFSSTEISPPPDHCPKCKVFVGVKRTKKRAPRTKPYIPKSGEALAWARRVNKSSDSVYRGMESASEQRMKDAAELLGVHPSKLSGMKTTDMKDNLRTGDMSFSHTPSSATQITGNVVGRGSFGGAGVPGIDASQSRPGTPTQQMQSTMSSVFSGHSAREAATAAAGIRK